MHEHMMLEGFRWSIGPLTEICMIWLALDRSTVDGDDYEHTHTHMYEY